MPDIWDLKPLELPGYGDPYFVGHLGPKASQNDDLFRHVLTTWYESGYCLHSLIPDLTDPGRLIIIFQWCKDEDDEP